MHHSTHFLFDQLGNLLFDLPLEGCWHTRCSTQLWLDPNNYKGGRKVVDHSAHRLVFEHFWKPFLPPTSRLHCTQLGANLTSANAPLPMSLPHNTETDQSTN